MLARTRRSTRGCNVRPRVAARASPDTTPGRGATCSTSFACGMRGSHAVWRRSRRIGLGRGAFVARPPRWAPGCRGYLAQRRTTARRSLLQPCQQDFPWPTRGTHRHQSAIAQPVSHHCRTILGGIYRAPNTALIRTPRGPNTNLAPVGQSHGPSFVQ